MDLLFNNITLIVFNYDRCIEEFFVNALSRYYDLPLSGAQKILERIEIHHPYGMVGLLPTSISHDDDIPFGGRHTEGDSAASVKDILKAAKLIRTFTEADGRINSLAENIRNAIVSARKIAFLGFAFHEANIRLLKPSVQSRVKTVFATTMNFSDSDESVIKERILDMLNITNDFERTAMNYQGANTTCGDLVNRYSLSIAN